MRLPGHLGHHSYPKPVFFTRPGPAVHKIKPFTRQLVFDYPQQIVPGFNRDRLVVRSRTTLPRPPNVFGRRPAAHNIFILGRPAGKLTRIPRHPPPPLPPPPPPP